MLKSTFRDTPFRSFSLETERLHLTVPTLDDFDDMHAMWSDMRVVGKVTGRPYSEEEIWARIHRIVGHWALMGYGHWVVRKKSSGKFVGEIGLFHFNRKLGPRFDNTREIGWMIAHESQQRGYASEAVTAALAWLDREGTGTETVCMIAPDNLASLVLAKKFGYEVIDEVVYKQEPMRVLRRRARTAE